MSGEKDTIVNIRQSEYNRLMNTCRRMDNINQTIQSNTNSMAGQLRGELNTRFQDIQRRHDATRHQISGLSDDMQRIERNFQSQINVQAREFQNNMESLHQELGSQRREYTEMIHQQGENFRRAMDAQYQELTSQITDIRQELQEKEENERHIAGQWLSDCQNYLQMIDSQYRHQKFKPGELAHLQAELNMVQNNLDQGQYQAAITNAQRTFMKAARLRMSLENLELEWEAHLEAAKCNATELIATCDAQNTCRFTFETEEGAEEIAGEIDFWTHGQLSSIRTQASEEMKKLGASNDLTLDDLKASMAQSEQWRHECLTLSEQAKQAIVAAQLRNNIGQTIEAALTDAGWDVTESVFEGDDFRQSLHVKLKNLPGDEMVTIISPIPGPNDTIQNKVNVSFFDRSTSDEQFRKSRLNAITQMFNEEGLEYTPPACAPGTENQACTDYERLDFTKVKQSKDSKQ
ncbi:hypothetical protein MHK_000824 [Candidatus Magnetomorum sp. HK-1]|nr:hypothetical protein MHK_000824 [Candidatus Magnetomorum sp. HK-1]